MYLRVTADPSETTANLSHSARSLPKKRDTGSFFLPPSLSRRLQGQSLSGYRLSPSAARLLLSRIGGIRVIIRIKMATARPEKITQVGSILEEKTISEVGSILKEKITQVGSILKENDTNGLAIFKEKKSLRKARY